MGPGTFHRGTRGRTTSASGGVMRKDGCRASMNKVEHVHGVQSRGAGSRAVGWTIHKDCSAGTSTYQKENGDDARDANCSVGA